MLPGNDYYIHNNSSKQINEDVDGSNGKLDDVTTKIPLRAVSDPFQLSNNFYIFQEKWL